MESSPLLNSVSSVHRSPPRPSSPSSDSCSPLTVSSAVSSIPIGGFYLLLLCFAGILFAAEAAVVNMLSFVLPILHDEWNLSPTVASIGGSVLFGGLAVGSLVLGALANRFGRRPILYSVVLGTFFSSLGASTLSFGRVELFCSWSFFIGFFVGGGCQATALLCEWVRPDFRDISVMLILLFWGSGAMLESLLAWATLPSHQPYSWRLFLGLSTVPTLIALALMPFIPESPRYLGLQGRRDTLIRSLRWAEKINRFCSHRDPIWTDSDLEEMGLVGDEDLSSSSSSCSEGDADDAIELLSEKRRKRCRVCLALWRSIRSNPRLVIAFVNVLFMFMVGSLSYYAVVLDTPHFFSSDQTGIPDALYLGSFVNSISEIPGSLVGLLFLRLFSRTGAQGLLFALLAFFLGLLALPVDSFLYLIIVSCCVRGSVMGASSALWVIVQETFPTSLRSIGSGVCNCAGKVLTTLAPQLVTLLWPEIDNGVVMKALLAVLAAVAAICGLFHCVDGGNKELMDRLDSWKSEDTSISEGR